jgi:hypothetical protein
MYFLFLAGASASGGLDEDDLFLELSVIALLLAGFADIEI